MRKFALKNKLGLMLVLVGVQTIAAAPLTAEQYGVEALSKLQQTKDAAERKKLLRDWREFLDQRRKAGIATKTDQEVQLEILRARVLRTKDDGEKKRINSDMIKLRKDIERSKENILEAALPFYMMEPLFEAILDKNKPECENVHANLKTVGNIPEGSRYPPTIYGERAVKAAEVFCGPAGTGGDK